MARNSISNTVLEASRVQLSKAVKLYGMKTYTLSTNFLSWDTDNNYNLTDIALTFGTRRGNSPVEVVGGGREQGFACGNGSISAYDFGLLYTVFTAMVMARVELGGTFPVVSENLHQDGRCIIWLGNDAVLYSASGNLIIPLKNADVERVCAGNKVKVSNFCGKDTYILDREGNALGVTAESGALLTFLEIPECVRKTYSHYFSHQDGVSSASDTGWVEDSMLGKLIGETDNRSECMAAYEQYKAAPFIGSIVSREDLIVQPTERYADTSNFFGSICYTDKGEIAIAVNFRKGLFVYYPWFTSGDGESREVMVDPSAKFSEFFNVTEGCNHILRYANTVINRPLTAAQFDLHVFEEIKTAFLGMKLSRIPIQAAFGRVVIPEKILLQELTGGTGESLFCMLPVGIVGSKVICLTSEGALSAVTPSGWDLTSAFYDVTEVVRQC